MKIQMIYDNTPRVSPIGKCWKVNLTKPVKRFDNNVYGLVLSLDRMEVEYDQFRKVLDDFAKKAMAEFGIQKIDNKIIYISDKGNASVYFSMKDKGQGAVKCYNEDGDDTEAPIDGDVVEVNYTLGAWMSDEGKAGVKVYLHFVTVIDRLGKPKVEKPFTEDDDDDGSWYDD